MTDDNSERAQNLTGVWHGLYSYAGGESVPFVATLIDSGSSLSGTTHEPRVFGNGPDTLYATLSGGRQESAVSFVKTYDGHLRAFSRPIMYEGTLNHDGTEIEGRWNIRRYSSGRFMMMRSAGKAASVDRKVVARA